mgnify:CR=1 FL=1
MISFHVLCKYAVNIPWLLLDKASVSEREGEKDEKGKPGREYNREQGIISVTLDLELP